jgi:tRNA A37 threonylcarbamoyladenosine synthetase subunit TsaC/SUA5/YrdC
MYDITNTKALERIARIGIKLDKANFSFVCYDLNNCPIKQIDTATSILKSFAGPYTFFYQETTICLSSKKKTTVGIRIRITPSLEIVQLGNPIVSTSIHDGMTL